MPEQGQALLSHRWIATYHADLLARLEWEDDAGWRTVTPPTQAVDEPVGYTPAPDGPIDTRHRLEGLRYVHRRRHLRSVA